MSFDFCYLTDVIKAPDAGNCEDILKVGTRLGKTGFCFNLRATKQSTEERMSRIGKTLTENHTDVVGV